MHKALRKRGFLNKQGEIPNQVWNDAYKKHPAVFRGVRLLCKIKLI